MPDSSAGMRIIGVSGVHIIRKGPTGQIMPTLLREQGYRLFFFSNEGTESPHIHVESGRGYAKPRLEPVEVVRSIGYKGEELAVIRELVIKNAGRFKENWDAYFGN
ncbi:MAG: DUF4160 domain-containing protein [Candidatus Moduliflexus flocculans]|nr:DUF4160 domain-containing protein [Candidatus Moduliflexus flocculans]